MVPEGWKIELVGDLFDVQLGKMLNKEAKEKTPQFHYLGNSNVKWGYFDLSDLKTMHFSERDIEKFTMKSDDIIMCEGGEVGRCAIWQGSNQNIFYQKALHRLRSKGQIVPQFFQNYMEKISGTKLLDDYTTRTSIAHLTREKLISLPVRLPPLPEQTQIAQILSTWDKAIATTEQLLANSQQQKKALMQQLLTGKKRLLDKNGVRFSGEWDIVNLDSVCDVKGGKRLPKGSYLSENKTPYPYIRVADMFMGGVDVASIQYVPEDIAPSIQRYRIFKDDLFITVAGTLGIVGEIPDALDGANLTENADKLTNIKCDKTYLLYVMKSDLIQKYIEAESTQNAQPKLALTRIRSFKVPTPGKEEQQKIAAVLSTADQEITALQQKLNALKQEKKALMQQLLTGKRRVKTEEAA